MTRYLQAAWLRGCLLLQPWQIHGHFSCQQSTWLKVSPHQWWRGTKTHWFAPLPSSTSHRRDFILRLLQRPGGTSFVLVNDHQEHSQQGQKYKTYLEHLCLCAGLCYWIKLRTGACSVTSWLSKWYLHSLTSQQQQVMASSPPSSQCQQKIVLK